MTKPTLVQSILNLPSQTYITHADSAGATGLGNPGNRNSQNHANATRPVKKEYYSTKQEMMRIAQAASASTMAQQQQQQRPQSTGRAGATRRPEAIIYPSTSSPAPKPHHRPPPPKAVAKANMHMEEEESDFDDDDDSDLDAFFTPNTSPRTSMASSAATIKFPTSRKPSRRSLSSTSNPDTHQGLHVPDTGVHPVPHTKPAPGGGAAAVPSTRTPSTPSAKATPPTATPTAITTTTTPKPRHVLSASSSLSSTSLEAHSLLSDDAVGSGESTLLTTPHHSDSSYSRVPVPGQSAKSTSNHAKGKSSSGVPPSSNAPSAYKGAAKPPTSPTSPTSSQNAVPSPVSSASTAQKRGSGSQIPRSTSTSTPASTTTGSTSTVQNQVPSSTKGKEKEKEKSDNAKDKDKDTTTYGTVTILPSGAPSSSSSSRANKKYAPSTSTSGVKQPHTFSAFAPVSPTEGGVTATTTPTPSHTRSSSTGSATNGHGHGHAGAKTPQQQSAERHRSSSGVPTSTSTTGQQTSSTASQAQKSARHASAPPAPTATPSKPASSTTTTPRSAPTSASLPTTASSTAPKSTSSSATPSTNTPAPTPTATPNKSPSPSPYPTPTSTPTSTPPSTISHRDRERKKTTPQSAASKPQPTASKPKLTPKPMPSGMVGMDALLEEEEEGEDDEGTEGGTGTSNRRAGAWNWGTEWERQVAAADAAAASASNSLGTWGDDSRDDRDRDSGTTGDIRPSRSLRHTSPHASDMRRRRSRSLDGGLDLDGDDTYSSHSHSSASTARKTKSTSTHTHSRPPPQTLSAEVRALVSDYVSPADRRPSKGTQGYTSLVLPRAPPPPSGETNSKNYTTKFGKLLPLNLKEGWLAPDGKIDLTKAGLASTTMASVEVVRGLGGGGAGGILGLGGLLGFRRRAFSAGSGSGSGSGGRRANSGPRPVPLPLPLKEKEKEKENGAAPPSNGSTPSPASANTNTILGFTSYRKPPNYVPSGSVLVQVWAVGVDGVDGRLVGVRFGGGGYGSGNANGNGNAGRQANGGGQTNGGGRGGSEGGVSTERDREGERDRDREAASADESWEEVQHPDLEGDTEDDYDHSQLHERTGGETETETDHEQGHQHHREAALTGDEATDLEGEADERDNGDDDLQMQSTPTPGKKGGFAALGRTWSFKLGRSHTTPSKGKEKEGKGDVKRSKSAFASGSASASASPSGHEAKAGGSASATASANSTPSKSKLRFESPKINGHAHANGHGHGSAPATPSNSGHGHKRSLSFSLGLKRNNTDASHTSHTTSTSISSSSQRPSQNPFLPSSQRTFTSNSSSKKDKALPNQPNQPTKPTPPSHPKKLKRASNANVNAKRVHADVGYIPGRSFVGRVLEVGWDVRDEVVRKGEWVVGLLDVRKAGALAEFIVVDRHRVHRVPHPYEGPVSSDNPPTSPMSPGGRPPAHRMLTLEELALLPLCGIPAYRAVRTFIYAFSSSSTKFPGTPSTPPSSVARQGFDFSATPTRKGSLSRGTSDHAQGYRRRALVLRGHDGPGAMAVQMLVRRGWRVSVHVPFSSVPANATQEVGDRFMHIVEERARDWGADEVIFDDGEEGGGPDDGRGAAVRVLDTLREDGDVFDAVLDTIGGKEVREAGERLLRSNGVVQEGSGRGKRKGVGQFTTLVGDNPERTIPSAGDHFRAGLRSLRPAGSSGGNNAAANGGGSTSQDQQPTSPSGGGASLSRANSGAGSMRVGYAWVSVAQDVDWEGDDIGETLRMVLRLALEDSVRPLVADLLSVDGADGQALVSLPRAVPFEKAPGVFVDNGPLRDGGTVVVKIAQ